LFLILSLSLSLSHTHTGKLAGRTSNGNTAGAAASWDNFHSLDILEVKRERVCQCGVGQLGGRVERE
jgi:hypothetical protein